MGMILATTILSRIDLVRDYPVVIASFAVVQCLGIYLLWRMLLGETERVSRGWCLLRNASGSLGQHARPRPKYLLV